MTDDHADTTERGHPGSPGPSHEEQADATVVAAPDSAAGSAAARRGGVTMPVAVPVTVAVVLGLAVGLILGWIIPRPGDSDDAATAAAAGAESANEADASEGTAEGESGAGTTVEAANVLSPAAPTPVEGGPDGTEEVAGLVIGDQGPLVEVFEDYVCPFCARLELSSGAQLREAALRGEYRLVVHTIAFLTEDSPRAANASACVYQHEDVDTWVAFHEAVYGRQDPSETAGQYTNEILVGVADDVGASTDATRACITDGDYEPWVAAITQQSFDRGVRGTPTVAVDGTITDVAPLVQ